jgi:catechol O-methyltransferase
MSLASRQDEVMSLRRRLPMLRWSMLRAAVGNRNFNRTGQLGDGRESAAADFVVAHARPGDPADALAALDEFAYKKSFLVNVGDEKGRLLDAAVRRADPRLALELGTYCGYGALRIAVAAPGAAVVSVELAEANAVVARRIWEHAGVAGRVSCVVGTIGDGERTLDLLEHEHGCTAGALDFLFIDHDKDSYLADLQRILGRGWLHPGSIVVADNVVIPGAPKYRRYMREEQGRQWQTVEHPAHVEYQTLLPDLVLESEYLGPAG